MKIKIFGVIAVLVLLFSAKANAQDSLKNEIGINTSIIIGNLFNSSGAPFDVLYKKQLAPNQYFRLGGNIHLYKTAEAFSRRGREYCQLSLAIGKEWRSEITERWTWIRGGEIAPSFTFIEDKGSQNEEVEWIDSQKSYGLGLRPFVGIIYNLNSRMSLATEASLVANVKYSTGSQIRNHPEGSTSKENEEWEYGFDIKPLTGIYFFYKF